MIRPAVVTLLAETPEAHGVFDPRVETRREVKCAVRSVSQNEFYRAMSAGIEPEAVFVFPYGFEYHGEKVFEFNSERWRVIRSYTTGQTLELTAGRATNDRTTVATTEVVSDG